MKPSREVPAPPKRAPFWRRLWFWLLLPCALVPAVMAMLMFWPGLEYKKGEATSVLGLRRSNDPDGSSRLFLLKAGPFCFLQVTNPGLISSRKTGWQWEDGMAGWGSPNRIVAAGWPDQPEELWQALDFLEDWVWHLTPP